MSKILPCETCGQDRILISCRNTRNNMAFWSRCQVCKPKKRSLVKKPTSNIRRRVQQSKPNFEYLKFEEQAICFFMEQANIRAQTQPRKIYQKPMVYQNRLNGQ